MNKRKKKNADKLQALIMQEGAAIRQDVAQKLFESMPGGTAAVLKKKRQPCKYWLCINLM